IEQRAGPEWPRRAEPASLRADQLCVALSALHDPAAALAGQGCAGPRDKRSKVLCPLLQLTIERKREVRLEPEIEEEPGSGEDDRHRERKGDRHAEADRDTAHALSSRRSR